MNSMSHADVMSFLLSLGVLLACARILGELARRWNQPAVLGEILAGILLGPTVFGALAPAMSAKLFPAEGPAAVALEGFTTLAITLFLLVAGMEVDLSTVWRQGRSALWVSVMGMAVPFGLGFGAAFLTPGLFGSEPESDRLIFSLFFATALSISALPVIAKILLDLNLFRTDLGMLVIAAAIFNDLVGWMIFAVVLGLMSGGGAVGANVAQTIWMTLGFAALLLTAGRWLLDRLLPWIQAHASWPGGVLGFALAAAILCAALTEWIGIHAIFGSFLFGVALGESRHLRERTRATLDQFISFIFAPLFFASIGLRVDFVAQFDWLLVLLVLLIATVGKVLGAGAGARWSGLNRRESIAVGFGLNARGAMEIILGLLALQAGVINERLFVALVVMALVTSILSGSVMERLLVKKKPLRLASFLTAKTFVKPLRVADRDEAIRALSALAAEALRLNPEEIAAEVLTRERLMSTGLGNEVAVPHARLDCLRRPLIAVGIAPQGVDFDARDERPARLVFLVLTPRKNAGAQLQLLADIGRLFRSPDFVRQAVEVANYTEFLAVLNSATAPPHRPESP